MRACLLLARRWRALALTCALAAALSVRAPVRHDALELYPRTRPHALAHLLADFSLQPNIGSWSVVSDRSNYTSWQYTVTYACGARCAGEAHVAAHEHSAGAPRHGHATSRAHTVTVHLRACTRLPLLPWPAFCDDARTETRVWSEDGEAARLHTGAVSRCAAPRVLSGACGAELRAHVQALHARLRSALTHII